MKKLVVILLIAILALSFTIPALASAPTVSARIIGNNANNGTLEITLKADGETVVESIAKPGNGTRFFTMDTKDAAYDIRVTFSGNTPVATILLRTPALPENVVQASSPAPPESGLPNNGGSDGQPNEFNGVVRDQYNNANFHCNGLGGNGRVWTTLGKNVTQKLDAPLYFVANTGQPVSNQANAATAWHLLNDDKVYVCEECGSSEWVTFSNNSGVPDGKNIQMNHPGQNFIIEKQWIMLEGDRVPSNPQFDAKYPNGLVRRLGVGSHFLPNDLEVTITERVPANFTLIEVKVNGETIDGLVAEGIKGGDKATFVNEENPYAMIIKVWADGNVLNRVAIFDIYDTDGKLVEAGARADRKYYLPIGEYVVIERDIPGYDPQPDQNIVIEKGKVAKVTFVNVRTTFDGVLDIAKTVEGIKIVEWAVDNGINLLDLIDDIFFNLHKATLDADGNPNGYEAASYPGVLNTSGIIEFEWADYEMLNGWYAVVESFVPGSLAEQIFADVGPFYVFFVNSEVLSSGSTIVFDFDYNATYTGIDKGNHFSAKYSLTALGQAKLDGFINAGGNMWEPSLSNPNPWFGNFHVRNDATGVEYPSFCGDWFSGMLTEPYDGHEPNRFAGEAAKAKREIISALNYINDNIGSITDWPVGKLIGQLAIWVLTDDGVEAILEINGSADHPYLALVNAAIEAGRAGYKTENTENFIYDIAYLTNSYFYDNRNVPGIGTGGFIKSQAQIVPIFATGEENEITFDNKVKGGTDGAVSFNKVKYGGLLPIDKFEEFAFDLFMKDGDDWELLDTYYTDGEGNVNVVDLAPGEYKFVEAITVDHDLVPGQEGNFGYRYVWNALYPGGADALYFTITKDGETKWRDTNEKIPVINNVHYCKHALQWTFAPNQAEYNWALSHANIVDDGNEGFGYFIYGGCFNANCTVITFEDAACGKDMVINIANNCPVNATGFRIGIPGTALVCSWKVDHVVLAGCDNRGYTRNWCELCGAVEDITDALATGHDMQLEDGAPWYLRCTKCGFLDSNPEYCWTCEALECICEPVQTAAPIAPTGDVIIDEDEAEAGSADDDDGTEE